MDGYFTEDPKFQFSGSDLRSNFMEGTPLMVSLSLVTPMEEPSFAAPNEIGEANQSNKAEIPELATNQMEGTPVMDSMEVPKGEASSSKTVEASIVKTPSIEVGPSSSKEEASGVQITGLEMEPYKGEEAKDICDKGFPPLRTFLKNAIKTAKSSFEKSPNKRRCARSVADGELVTVPIQLQTPETNQNTDGEAYSNQVPKQGRQTRTKTILTGRIPLVFQITSQEQLTCFTAEVEKVSVSELVAQDNRDQLMDRLSEKLDGWQVERRKRSNGRVDTFFHHNGILYRSEVEVLDFVINDCYPFNFQFAKKRKAFDEVKNEEVPSDRPSKRLCVTGCEDQSGVIDKRPRGRPRKISEANSRPIIYGEPIEVHVVNSSTATDFDAELPLEPDTDDSERTQTEDRLKGEGNGVSEEEHGDGAESSELQSVGVPEPSSRDEVQNPEEGNEAL